MTISLKAPLAAAVALAFVLGVSACSSSPADPKPISTPTVVASPEATPTPTPTPTEASPTADIDVLPVLVEPAGVPEGWTTTEVKGLTFASPPGWSYFGDEASASFTSVQPEEAASPPVTVDDVTTSTNSNIYVDYVTDQTKWTGNWTDADERSYRLSVPGAKYAIAEVSTRSMSDGAQGNVTIQQILGRIVSPSGAEWTVTIYVAQGEAGTALAHQVLASLVVL